MGILLVLLGPWGFTQLWVLGAVALYVVLLVVGLGVRSPTLTRLIASYESGGAATAEFGALSARSATVGSLLGVVVVAIIVLMVVKPGA